MAIAVKELAEALLAGHTRALARAISLVENGAPEAARILQAVAPHVQHAPIVGVTGAPGVGKSTLVGACARAWCKQGLQPGVIAIDPSSPLSGGAILGDRLRMAEAAVQPGVFIRSVASRGALGGIVPTTLHIADLMDAAGKRPVLLETVGAGQSEVDMAQVADTRVVVCAPNLGDDIQAIKAGILEIADILVVNKCDLPGACHTVGQLRAMQELKRGGGLQVPVVETAADRGEGIDALMGVISAHQERAGSYNGAVSRRRRGTRTLLAMMINALVREELSGKENPGFDGLCEAVAAGELDVHSAARQWLSGRFG